MIGQRHVEAMGGARFVSIISMEHVLASNSPKLGTNIVWGHVDSYAIVIMMPYELKYNAAIMILCLWYYFKHCLVSPHWLYQCDMTLNNEYIQPIVYEKMYEPFS